MGLLPGVTYRLSVTAVSEAFGTVAESDHSNVLEATTDFTGRKNGSVLTTNVKVTVWMLKGQELERVCMV